MSSTIQAECAKLADNLAVAIQKRSGTMPYEFNTWLHLPDKGVTVEVTAIIRDNK